MYDIAPVSPARLFEALQLLYSRLSAPEREAQCERTLLAVARQELSTESVLTATSHEGVVGVLYAVRQPGQTAFVWPPVVRADADERGATDGLLQSIGRRFDAAGVAFAQCLLPVDDRAAREALDRNRFLFRGDLLFQSCDLTKNLPGERRTPLTFVTPADSTLERFARVVEQTYQGSLDCPCLEGVRSGEAALEAHRSAGHFDSELWRLYQWRGIDAGITLLARQDDPESWEVVYTGVTPAFRGRGIGSAMMHAALRQAQSHGATRMHLAVDCRNRFARQIYSDLGFEGQGLRSVHLRLRNGAD